MMNNQGNTYKQFDFSKMDVDVQDIYKRYIDENPKHKEILDDLLNPTERVVELNDRPYPNYIGLDNEGMPTQEKVKYALKRALSGDAFVINFEGGVRGGKDIWAIYIWTKYLMISPEPIHLVLGKSLEHALITVLHSNGFGLMYTIPNGTFERNSEKGAQRGIFKFIDAYGRHKEIMFYGNDKENDHEKFQGFTIGSTYIVEGMTQHINGLNQALQRMASTKNHLMILTQNPKGEGSKFYTEFEKSKLFTMEEIEFIEAIRDNYKDEFNELQCRIMDGWNVNDEGLFKIKSKFIEEYGIEKYKDYFKYRKLPDGTYHVLSAREINALKKRDDFYKKHDVPKDKTGYEFLSEELKVQLNDLLYKNNQLYENQLRAITVGQFQKDLLKKNNPSLQEDHKFASLSMKKVINYQRGGDNPNGIYNAIDYDYFHFTIEDNLAMDEMAREEFGRQFAKGSAVYDRNVRGIRRTTDGAVFSNFVMRSGEHGNLLDVDIDYFNNSNTVRVVSMDFGMNHYFAMIDCEVDLQKGIVYQLQEELLELKDETTKGFDYMYNIFMNMVRRRKNRKMPDYIIADPSNKALIVEFKTRGIEVKKANNSVFQARGEEKTKAIKTEKKDIIGIDLVQTAVGKRKYKIHPSNTKTIKQMLSYETFMDEKSGEIKVNKINDDLVDTVRYVFNTIIKPFMWLGEEENESNNPIKERNEVDFSKVQEYINEEFGEQEEYDSRSKYLFGFSNNFWD